MNSKVIIEAKLWSFKLFGLRSGGTERDGGDTYLRQAHLLVFNMYI